MDTEDSEIEGGGGGAETKNGEILNIPQNVCLSNGTLDGPYDYEPRFVFPPVSDDGNGNGTFPSLGTMETMETIPGASGTVQVKRIPSLRHVEQQADTVELSLEGLQSSGQGGVTEEGEESSQVLYNMPSGASPSQDVAPGVTSPSRDPCDERLAQHGGPAGVFRIAPLKLQVSETRRPCPAIEDTLRQGRQPFEVVLRGGTPWGFALNGGTGTGLPVYISKVGYCTIG
ncbi:hypothetical protein EGW08_017626 [Elysia chlorotica]|uniref:PDZ domain-containing protein n=1 Tax=Elysia chlorotica TaxID=188477 RepID=A0A3S1BTN8_ELYCH|nr:hypothetical protein EGW08_017626 [Elysia chlorotica]